MSGTHRRNFLVLSGLGISAVFLLGLSLPGNGGGEGDLPLLCGGWHRGSGHTDPVDLAAVRRAYADLERRLKARMEGLRVEITDFPDRPLRSGLPACRGPAVRVERLHLPGADRLDGSPLAFVSIREGRPPRLPAEVRDNPRTTVFVLDCPRLGDLGEISRSLGRPVYLAEASLARAFGVRCSGCWIRLSGEKGTVEIHEDKSD